MNDTSAQNRLHAAAQELLDRLALLVNAIEHTITSPDPHLAHRITQARQAVTRATGDPDYCG